MWSEDSADRAVMAWLLSPYSIEQFAAEYYEGAPLHVARNAPNHYAQYFSLAEMQRVLYGSELRTSDLQVIKNGTAARAEAYTRTLKGAHHPLQSAATDIVHADRVSALFASGCTLVLDFANKYSPSLAQLCRRIESFFRCHANPNVYLTPPGNKGFALHYDTHDAIVVQIEGSKHWRVYEPAFPLPLEHQYWDKKRYPAGRVLIETEMRAGDLLYVPRGCLHEAAANDTLSLHVTIGLYPPIWMQVALRALTHAAESTPSLRASAEEDSLSRVLPILQEALAPERLLAALQSLRRDWLSMRDNDLDGQIEQIAMLSCLSETSLVARRPDVLYEIGEHNGLVELTFSGKTLSLPKDAAGIIAKLATVTAVRVADLPADAASALKIMRRLIQEGFALQTPADRIAGGEAVA